MQLLFRLEMFNLRVERRRFKTMGDGYIRTNVFVTILCDRLLRSVYLS
jgi:hypothetical protein